jgi:hypothetical protein
LRPLIEKLADQPLNDPKPLTERMLRIRVTAMPIVPVGLVSDLGSGISFQAFRLTPLSGCGLVATGGDERMDARCVLVE